VIPPIIYELRFGRQIHVKFLIRDRNHVDFIIVRLNLFHLHGNRGKRRPRKTHTTYPKHKVYGTHPDNHP